MIDRRVRALLLIDGLLALALIASSLGGEGRSTIDFRLPPLAQIEGLRITRTGQPPVTLRRAGGRWSVQGDPIDPYALDALTEAMGDPVGADLAVPAEGAELDDYGLGEHAVTVAVDGGPTLRIGRVVDGRRTFVWPVDGPRILRLRADLGRVFHRPAAHWPDRRLAALDFADVAELTVSRGEALDWRARRPGPDAPWRLLHPPGLEAGQQEIGAVLGALVTARAERFVPPADGFEPTATLSGSTFDGGAFSIALAPGEGGTLRARLPERARLAVIPKHQAVFLDVRAADLRERRIFGGLAVDALDGVAIGGPDPLRAARGPDGRWRLSAPRETGPLDGPAVDGWLSALVGLRAVGFVERPDRGAFAEAWPVALKAGDAAVQLEVGAPFGNGARLVRRIGAEGPAMVLGASGLATLRPAIDALTGEGPEGDQPPGR